MSLSDNRYQAERWLLTAREDLKAVKALLEAGAYAQACFYAQKAAEKAVKALWRLVDQDLRDHSVGRLIDEFPRKAEIPDLPTLTGKAAALDKFYIPTRYPNGLPALTPSQIYGAEDADQPIEASRMIVDACEAWLLNH